MKTLVAIKTCHKPEYFAKAQAQWQTWAQGVLPMADVIFFCGRHPVYGAVEQEIMNAVWLDASDDYLGIPRKVQLLCQWAHARNYGRTLLLDDDVYVVPSRFPNLLTELDSVGRFRGPHGGYPAYFASGFAYFLSRRALEIVANTPWNGDWMDERFVANALAARGIFGYTDDANYRVSGPHTLPHTLPHSYHAKGTVFCEYGAAEIRELHKTMGNAPPTNYKEAKPMPQVSITNEVLAMPPRDSAPARKVYRR
jgi:hypothetical protein